MALVPDVPDVATYRRLHCDETVWRPAIDAIAERHRICGPFHRPREGSNVVFIGRDRVIKFFAAPWSEEAEIEAHALERCEGRLPVATPRLHVRGELEGRPYLVLTRLAGRELADVWSMLDDADKLRRVAEAAELLAALHRIECEPPPFFPDAWEQLRRPLEDVRRKHEAEGADPRWITDALDLLGEAAPVSTWDSPTVFLHGDVHPEHLMVDDDGRITGLFDFADMMVGPAEYDLAATSCLMAARVPGGADVFHRTYGQRPAREHLAVALLRQRYCALRFAVAAIPEPLRPRNVAELIDLSCGAR